MAKKNKPQQIATEFRPHVTFNPTVIPLGGGKFEVIAGKPIVMDSADTIDTKEFAKRTGLSQSYVQQMCAQGVINCRRMSMKPDSKFLIPISELQRHLDKTKDAR
jgi:hypothetical protein